jgi:hypothetical protein
VRSRPIRRSSRLLPFALVAVAATAPLALIGLAHAGDAPKELKTKVAGYRSLLPQAYASTTASDAHYFTLREFDPLVPPEFNTVYSDPERDVAIAIYGEGNPSYGNPEFIRIAGARATPATLVVPSGVTIAFRNDDPFLHHLTGAEDFDLKPGEQHKLQPKANGVLAYTDTLSRTVRVWIVVDDRVKMQKAPAHDGSFKISLDPGTYTFTAFFEGKPKDTVADFKVPEKGSATPLRDLQVAPAGSASGK